MGHWLERLVDIKIDQQQVFSEHFSQSDGLSGSIQYHAGSIEDQFIVVPAMLQ
jgi:hypothetical protein